VISNDCEKCNVKQFIDRWLSRSDAVGTYYMLSKDHKCLIHRKLVQINTVDGLRKPTKCESIRFKYGKYGENTKYSRRKKIKEIHSTLRMI
jgi:hypothetical protein